MKNTITSVVILISTGIFAQTSSISSDSKNFYKSDYLDMTNAFVGQPSLVLVDSALKGYVESIKKHLEIIQNFSKAMSDNNIVKYDEKNKEKFQSK